MGRRKTTRYVPRTYYTERELLIAEILDLEVDLRCAYRDGQPEYAVEVEALLVTKNKQLADMPPEGTQ